MRSRRRRPKSPGSARPGSRASALPLTASPDRRILRSSPGGRQAGSPGTPRSGRRAHPRWPCGPETGRHRAAPLKSKFPSPACRRTPCLFGRQPRGGALRIRQDGETLTENRPRGPRERDPAARDRRGHALAIKRTGAAKPYGAALGQSKPIGKRRGTGRLNTDQWSSALLSLGGLLISGHSVTYTLGSLAAPESGMMPFLSGAAICLFRPSASCMRPRDTGRGTGGRLCSGACGGRTA